MIPPPTERLEFRRWRTGDLALATALWGDPDVTALISAGPIDVAARLEAEIACDRDHGVQYWPAFDRETGELAGCAGLRPYRVDDGVWELGVHLRPAFWGRGLATEASRALIAFAFESFGARALFAGHNPANHGSRRLLEKLGFRRVGTERYQATGLEHPSYILDAP